MNKPGWVAMILVLVLTGLIVLGMAGVVHASGRYPRAMQVTVEKVDVLSSSDAIFSEVGSYHTLDELATVEAWYMSHYRIEPGPSSVAQGSCVRLAKVNAFGNLRQAVVVSLCAAVHGTQVDFNQRLYLHW